MNGDGVKKSKRRKSKVKSDEEVRIFDVVFCVCKKLELIVRKLKKQMLKRNCLRKKHWRMRRS